MAGGMGEEEEEEGWPMGVWVGEESLEGEEGEEEEEEAEEVPGVFGPSDFEMDGELFDAPENGMTGGMLGTWPPSPSGEPDDDDPEARRMSPPATGEENFPASCPTAEATAVVVPPKMRQAPPPEPSRPTGLPLKPAGGVVNKKRGAPKRVIAARPHASKPRPFRCTYAGCGYAAAKRRYLLEHERVHSGERPYKCTWPGCTYAASGQGHISRHKRTHTGDRPYPCKYPGCTYQASQSGHLRTHMRTHTGERPFRCTVAGCDYAAGRKGHLDRHMRVHTHPRLVTSTSMDKVEG